MDGQKQDLMNQVEEAARRRFGPRVELHTKTLNGRTEWWVWSPTEKRVAAATNLRGLLHALEPAAPRPEAKPAAKEETKKATTSKNGPEWLDAPRAAKLTGYAASTLTRYAKAGAFPWRPHPKHPRWTQLGRAGVMEWAEKRKLLGRNAPRRGRPRGHQESPEPGMWTAVQVAAELGISQTTVSHACNTGEMAGHRHGRLWLVRPEDARAWDRTHQRNRGPRTNKDRAPRPSRLLTIPEAAARIGVHLTTLHWAVRKGRLRAVEPDGRNPVRMVSEAELERYVAADPRHTPVAARGKAPAVPKSRGKAPAVPKSRGKAPAVPKSHLLRESGLVESTSLPTMLVRKTLVVRMNEALRVAAAFDADRRLWDRLVLAVEEALAAALDDIEGRIKGGA
jgi:excisionase family DNA binding protein